MKNMCINVYVSTEKSEMMYTKLTLVRMEWIILGELIPFLRYLKIVLLGPLIIKKENKQTGKNGP